MEYGNVTKHTSRSHSHKLLNLLSPLIIGYIGLKITKKESIGSKEVRNVRQKKRCQTGLDHGIGHLASMSPQKNERLLPSKG
jgi:hypothetical protein